MKFSRDKYIIQIITFSIVLIFVCCVFVILLNQPALFNFLSISDGSVGDAVGGITSPIIGIISSVLLYLALTKQVESNKDQRLKNECDVIFSLLNQLDNELNNFYFEFTTGSIEKRYSGLEGLDKFTQKFSKEWDLKVFKSNSTFKSFYQSGQIILIIDSYNLIFERIEISNLNLELRNLFKFKLSSFYTAKLRDSFMKIETAIDENQFLKDDWSQKLKLFISKN